MKLEIVCGEMAGMSNKRHKQDKVATALTFFKPSKQLDIEPGDSYSY
jgi:hypothetical protein